MSDDLIDIDDIKPNPAEASRNALRRGYDLAFSQDKGGSPIADFIDLRLEDSNYSEPATCERIGSLMRLSSEPHFPNDQGVTPGGPELAPPSAFMIPVNIPCEVIVKRVDTKSLPYLVRKRSQYIDPISALNSPVAVGLYHSVRFGRS
jgi:hypothetical protein